MMPAAIGNPHCTSNPIVTAAVSQPLAVETKPMRVELNDEPLDLLRVEHVRADGEALPDPAGCEKRQNVVIPGRGLCPRARNPKTPT